MLISSPLSSLEELKPLIEAGADEFYCGIVEGSKKSDLYLNRRPSILSNFRSFAEIEKAAEICKEHKKKISIAFNESHYTPSQEKSVLDTISRLSEAGISSFILANLSIIQEARARHPGADINASCVCHILNSESAKFYRVLGANSITLPLDLDAGEVKKIVESNKETDFKCFVLQMGCRNINGLCSYYHYPDEKKRWVSTPCTSCKIVSVSRKGGKEDPKTAASINRANRLNVYNCSLCRMHDYSRIGIKGVKIVGRSSPLGIKLKDVIAVRKLRDFLDSPPSKDDFTQECKKVYKIRFKEECTFKCTL